MNSTPLARIEEMRKEQGRSCAYVMRMIGVSRNTYWNWMRSGNIPSSKLVALADLFGCSTDILLGRDADGEVPGMRYFFARDDKTTHLIAAKSLTNAIKLAEGSKIKPAIIYELKPDTFAEEGFLLTQA